MADPGLTRLPDWLVVAQEEWDQVERRNQLLVRALAERHPLSRFLFAETPLRPRDVRRWRPPRPQRVARNIWRVRVVRPLPSTARLGGLSDRVECAQLRRTLRELGIQRPALWTQDPRTATLVDLLPVERIVYDLTDDWAALERDPARREAMQARIESLGRRSELVLACSRTLARDAALWSDHVHYLPNAVEPPGSEATPPAELAGLPRPRLGYVGTLHSARLDVALLAQVAELRPSWPIVLLGPDQLVQADRERLFSLRNVQYVGVRPHASVRAYLEALDICLLPHQVTEFTRSLDPLKLYEYLAAGRPVVATRTGNVPDLQDFLAYADTAEETVAVIEAVLAQESPERVYARRAAVAGSTWDARAHDIERALHVKPTRV